jgi:hypothetical protein
MYAIAKRVQQADRVFMGRGAIAFLLGEGRSLTIYELH